MIKPKNSKKHRYVSDFADDMDINNASSAYDCTGLIPTLPQSDEEIDSYKHIYDFMPPYYEDKV